MRKKKAAIALPERLEFSSQNPNQEAHSHLQRQLQAIQCPPHMWQVDTYTNTHIKKIFFKKAISIWEAKAGELQLQAQPGLHSKTVERNKQLRRDIQTEICVTTGTHTLGRNGRTLMRGNFHEDTVPGAGLDRCVSASCLLLLLKLFKKSWAFTV